MLNAHYQLSILRKKKNAIRDDAISNIYRLPRRGGGKRIRMDDPIPADYEEELYRGNAG